MKEILSKAQIIALHHQLIVLFGGEDGLRDDKALEAAIAQPLQTFDGADLYPTAESKAACLWYGLIMDHPFLDGNKRVGTHAMLIFLLGNGYQIAYEKEDLIDFTIALASGERSMKDAENWIAFHLKK